VRFLVSHVGVFDIRVHTANTFSFGDLEENEALVTPASAPRVLNLPVVVVTIGVLKHAARVVLVAGVPPLVNVALGIVIGIGLRLRLGAGIRRRATVLLSVADEDDGVVKTSGAAIVFTNDTLGVELEVGAAGINSDSERLVPQFLFDLVEATTSVDPVPAGDLTNSLAAVVCATALGLRSARSVRIIAVEHDTVFALEVPGSGHPAATATPEAEVLTEEVHVVTVVAERAVNEVLLRHADGISACLGGDGTLKGRVGGESPAGAAAALVLDTDHMAIFNVIDSSSIDDAETTSVVAEATALVVKPDTVA